MERVYLDFNSLEQDGISKTKTIDYLRNNLNTNIAWEEIDKKLSNLPKDKQEEITYNLLKNDKNWVAYPLNLPLKEQTLENNSHKEPLSSIPIKENSNSLKEPNLPNETNLENLHKGEFISPAKSNIVNDILNRDTKVKTPLESIQYFFSNEEKKENEKYRAKAEVFKNDFLNKVINNEEISQEEQQAFLKLGENEDIKLKLARTKGEEAYKKESERFLKEKIEKEKQTRRILSANSFNELSEEDKKRVKSETSTWGKLWNNDEEELTNWQKDNKHKLATKEAKDAIIHLQNIHEHTSIANFMKNIISEHVDEKTRNSYFNDLKQVSKLYGFENVGYDQENGDIYFVDNKGKFYKAEHDFLGSIAPTLLANKFSIGGGISGSIMGAKYAPNDPRAKAAGAIIGGAIGSYAGAGLDAIISNQILNRDNDFSDIHRHMLENGALSIVGDGVILGLVKGKNGILKLTTKGAKALGEVANNIAPLRILKENITGEQNIQAAKEAALNSFTKEEREELFSFAKKLGGSPKALKEQSGDKTLEFLKNKFGEDSKIYKTASKFREIFNTPKSLKAQQQELLSVIRSNEGDESLAILLEAANINPQVSKNLKNMLHLTTAQLDKKLQEFKINPQDIKLIFDDYEKGTKEAYKQAHEKILSKIYDENYKVVLDSKKFDDFYNDLINNNYELPSTFKNTLNSIKNKVYNPNGVTYSNLEATRKSLNSLYSEDNELNGYLKNFISSHLKEDIEKGMDLIFSQNKKAYEEAKRLYETNLKDYAQLKEIQNYKIYEKIENVENSLDKIAKEILENAKGAGKVERSKTASSAKLKSEATRSQSEWDGGAYRLIGTESVPPFKEEFTTPAKLKNNFEELTKGLTEQNRQSLELNLLNKLYKDSMVERDGLKSFASKEFLKSLEDVKEIFKSKGAKEYIQIIEDFNKLFKRDADILAALKVPIAKEVGNALSTTATGGAKHMLAKGFFDWFYRNLPNNSIIFKALGLGDGIKRAALRYHLGKALKEASSLEEFNFKITQRATRGNFNSQTKELVEKMVEELSDTKESIIKSVEDFIDVEFSKSNIILPEQTKLIPYLRRIANENKLDRLEVYKKFMDFKEGKDNSLKDFFMRYGIKKDKELLEHKVSNGEKVGGDKEEIATSSTSSFNDIEKTPITEGMPSNDLGGNTKNYSAVQTLKDDGFFKQQKEYILKNEKIAKEFIGYAKRFEAEGDKQALEDMQVTAQGYKRIAQEKREELASYQALRGYKPLSEFGTNYIEFIGDGKGAIEKLLLEREGQVASAFYKEGLGDIDLVWGDSKMGLAHILEKHSKDFKAFGEGESGITKGISEIVENGKVVSDKGVNTIIYTQGENTYRIGISKGYFDKGENNWIITGYKVDKKSPHSDSLPSNEIAKSDGTNLHPNDLTNYSTKELKGKEFKKLWDSTKEIRELISKLEKQSREKSIFKDKQSSVFTGGGIQLGGKYKAQSKEQKDYLYRSNLEFFLEQNDIDIQLYKELKTLYDNKATLKEKALKYDEIIKAREAIKQRQELEKQNTINTFDKEAFIHKELKENKLENITDLQNAINRAVFDKELFEIKAQTLIKHFFNKDLEKLNKEELIEFYKNAQNANYDALEEFGTNYAEFYKDGKGAIEKLLLEREGQVASAFYKEGLGDIDLVWGDSKMGLSHILERREEDFIKQGFSKEEAEAKAREFIKNIPEIIEKGEAIIKKNEAVKIETDNYKLVLKQNWKGEPTTNKWLVTGYFKKEKEPSISTDPFTKEENLSLNSKENYNTKELKELQKLNEYTKHLAALSPQEQAMHFKSLSWQDIRDLETKATMGDIPTQDYLSFSTELGKSHIEKYTQKRFLGFEPKNKSDEAEILRDLKDLLIFSNADNNHNKFLQKYGTNKTIQAINEAKTFAKKHRSDKELLNNQESLRGLGKLYYILSDMEKFNDEELAKWLDLSKWRNAIEEANDIKPLKEFGTNYAEFYKKGNDAIQKLLAEKQGQVASAFYKEGLGDIDLVWGDSKMGLSHILERREEDFIKQGFSKEEAEAKVLELIKEIPQILENSTIYKQTPQKIELITPRHTLVLGLRDDRKFIITELIDKRNKKRFGEHQTGVADTLTDETLANKPLSSSQIDTAPSPADPHQTKHNISTSSVSRANGDNGNYSTKEQAKQHKAQEELKNIFNEFEEQKKRLQDKAKLLKEQKENLISKDLVGTINEISLRLLRENVNDIRDKEIKALQDTSITKEEFKQALDEFNAFYKQYKYTHEPLYYDFQTNFGNYEREFKKGRLLNAKDVKMFKEYFLDTTGLNDKLKKAYEIIEKYDFLKEQNKQITQNSKESKLITNKANEIKEQLISKYKNSFEKQEINKEANSVKKDLEDEKAINLKARLENASDEEKGGIIKEVITEQNNKLLGEIAKLQNVLEKKDFLPFEIDEKIKWLSTKSQFIGEDEESLKKVAISQLEFNTKDKIKELQKILKDNKVGLSVLEEFLTKVKDPKIIENKVAYESVKDTLKRLIEKNQKRALKILDNEIKERKLAYKLNTQEGEKRAKELFYSFKPDSEQIELFERLLPIAQNLDVEVKQAINDEFLSKQFAGVYYTDKNSVRIKNNRIHKEKGKVFLHELIHSVTSRAIIAYESGKKELLSANQIKAIENIKELYSEVYKNHKELGFETFEEFFTGSKGDYGLKNSHEFIAELSNPTFREKLKKVGVFEKLVDNILKLFVSAKDAFLLKKNNAYESLKKNLYELIDNYKEDFTKSYEKENIKGVDLKQSKELENAFLDESGKIVYEKLEEFAKPLPKELNLKEFVAQFNNDKKAVINTPIKQLEINPKYAFYHLLKNHPLGNNKENRKFISGGILQTLQEPLFITKDSKGSIFFYKPFKTDNNTLHLTSVEVDVNDRLKYKTSYIADRRRLYSMIKNYELLYIAGGVPPL
ncbi:hypothetical protein B6S12_07610 [Helicobacter valdiviensis]|uniref:Phage-Barnase-EndoU-ColicinE5/D-RelE-like nuclease domain-containing protein n=1 Tax=Helicobacter valdiviensis TaxID=1458358 RepID=A0A2W6MUX0_9HELI|nr:hypothetical protein [Helicobacter valdiviensis]PZT47719.1 hypothetical protein B6S12_07610 [Helicobacter valdiviensis]